MSYQVLARKYRPQKFSDVIGQEHVTRTLKNAIEQGRIAHGYIFSGHRGIGKTTIARILAMALNCRSSDHPVPEPCGVCDSCREIREGSVGAMDVIEIDAATNRGIEEVRALIATATAEPARDRYRIFILDEAHQVTDAAFNALLKTLEEPPPWVVFMMATTQPEDIPQTIRSRCQHFSFHAVKFDEIVAHLTQIAKQEGIKADADAIALLAEAGDGSMRDALSIMDQAIACCGTTLTSEVVRGLVGTVASDLLEKVMQSVQANCSEEVLRIVDKLMVEGHSAVHFARQLVRFLRNALVAKVAGGESPLLQISPEERQRVARVAELFSEEDLTRFLQIMLRTHSELGYKQEQRFLLELGLLKLVHAQRLLPLEQVLSEAAAQAPSPAQTQRAAATSRPVAAATARPPARPSFEADRASSPFDSDARSTSRPSPFEADRNRKARSETVADPQATSTPTSFARAADTAVRVIDSPFARTGAATAVAVEAPPEIVADPVNAEDPKPPASVPEAPETNGSVEAIRETVLKTLEQGDARMLVSALETAEWAIDANELVIKLAMSQKMLDHALGLEHKKLITQTATRVAGRPLKLRAVSGGTNMQPVQAAPRASGGPGVRTRAAEDPVVRRMIEKFGAEIRTVIDHREK